MRSHVEFTRDQIVKWLLSLRADDYIVRLVPDDEHPASLPVISERYSRSQMCKLDMTKFFRGRNRDGYNVYGRPDSARFILVDDIGRDALDQMVEDRVRPCRIVCTSRRNYQAWLKLSAEEIEQSVARAAVSTAAQNPTTWRRKSLPLWDARLRG
jgi:hypothetical protein